MVKGFVHSVLRKSVVLDEDSVRRLWRVHNPELFTYTKTNPKPFTLGDMIKKASKFHYEGFKQAMILTGKMEIKK